MEDKDWKRKTNRKKGGKKIKIKIRHSHQNPTVPAP